MRKIHKSDEKTKINRDRKKLQERIKQEPVKKEYKRKNSFSDKEDRYVIVKIE